MKKLIIILLFPFLACTQEVMETGMQTIHLKNSLRALTLIPVPGLDTLYTWVNTNDTHCGYLSMTRLANKKYSLLNESGFIYTKVPDSLYQITVAQNEYADCKNKSLHFDYVRKADAIIQQILAENPREKPQVTISIIHDIKYIITTRENRKENKHSISLHAQTVINGEMLSVTYTYSGSNPAKFIERALTSIKTLKIYVRESGDSK